MEKKEDSIRLKAVLVKREVLEERYGFKFTDLEWNIFQQKIQQSWSSEASGLQNLVFRHINQAMQEIGFRTRLEGKDIIFSKSEWSAGNILQEQVGLQSLFIFLCSI